jgi:hypothetical protein
MRLRVGSRPVLVGGGGIAAAVGLAALERGLPQHVALLAFAALPLALAVARLAEPAQDRRDLLGLGAALGAVAGAVAVALVVPAAATAAAGLAWVEWEAPAVRVLVAFAVLMASLGLVAAVARWLLRDPAPKEASGFSGGPRNLPQERP